MVYSTSKSYVPFISLTYLQPLLLYLLSLSYRYVRFGRGSFTDSARFANGKFETSLWSLFRFVEIPESRIKDHRGKEKKEYGVGGDVSKGK